MMVCHVSAKSSKRDAPKRTSSIWTRLPSCRCRAATVQVRASMHTTVSSSPAEMRLFPLLTVDRDSAVGFEQERAERGEHNLGTGDPRMAG